VSYRIPKPAEPKRACLRRVARGQGCCRSSG
jgi:hypothetical protein